MAANKVGAAGGEEEEKPVPPPIMIEISISCRKLANKDKLSKSDPICVVLHRPHQHNKKWVEFMRTELMCNNLNPDFATKLVMEYRFEQSKLLRFHIFDVDAPTEELPDDDDSMGFADCSVADIVTAGAKGFTKELEVLPGSGDDGAKGSVLLIAEELADLKDEVFLEMSGYGVGSWTTCCSVKSFFVISRANSAGNFLLAHRCAETKGQNPWWPPLKVEGRSLCNGNNDRQLKIEIWRKTLKNEDELVGLCFTTINRMESKLDHVMALQDLKGKKSKVEITIQKCTITPIYTFMNYIQAGTKIHLCFSIDFTSSNGDPMVPKSLHHVSANPNITNVYEQAIYATANIIKEYDEANIFHVYGFGARIPPHAKLSHNFPITLTDSAACHGVEGVIDAYKKCVKTVQLFGPTCLAPTIKIITKMAEDSKGGEDYYVLVIICDGVITDVEPTKEAVVKASHLPVSIIIVGVGKAEFGDMDELDGNKKVLSFKGREAARDIVQFVAYRSAEHWLKTTGEDTKMQPPPKDMPGMILPPPMGKDDKKKETANKAEGKLAEAVLAEIPEQIVGYMKTQDRTPKDVAKAARRKQKLAGKKVDSSTDEDSD